MQASSMINFVQLLPLADCASPLKNLMDVPITVSITNSVHYSLVNSDGSNLINFENIFLANTYVGVK